MRMGAQPRHSQRWAPSVRVRPSITMRIASPQNPNRAVLVQPAAESVRVTLQKMRPRNRLHLGTHDHKWRGSDCASRLALRRHGMLASRRLTPAGGAMPARARLRLLISEIVGRRRILGVELSAVSAKWRAEMRNRGLRTRVGKRSDGALLGALLSTRPGVAVWHRSFITEKTRREIAGSVAARLFPTSMNTANMRRSFHAMKPAWRALLSRAWKLARSGASQRCRYCPALTSPVHGGQIAAASAPSRRVMTPGNVRKLSKSTLAFAELAVTPECRERPSRVGQSKRPNAGSRRRCFRNCRRRE